jgi:hypothetical protein
MNVWGNKIVTLLNHHMITLFRRDTEIWTIMQSDTDGKVRAYIFKKLGPDQRGL